MRPGPGDLSRQFRQMPASGLSAGIGAGMTIAACFIPFARADGGRRETVLGYTDRFEILPGVRSLCRKAAAEPQPIFGVAASGS